MWKIDWLDVFLYYLFLCLFDDANWSKYRGDVGEVIWFTEVTVTRGCPRVLSSWWMFEIESVAPTTAGSLFNCWRRGKSHLWEYPTRRDVLWGKLELSQQIKGPNIECSYAVDHFHIDITCNLIFKEMWDKNIRKPEFFDKNKVDAIEIEQSF